MTGKPEMLTFIAAYIMVDETYIPDPICLVRWSFSEDFFAETVTSTLEDAPHWVRKRVALINVACDSDEEDCEVGGWSTDSEGKAYWIVVIRKTALTWGKGWRKKD
jgi:hypothetical protein